MTRQDISVDLQNVLKAIPDKSVSITVQIRSRFDSVPQKPFFLLEMLSWRPEGYDARYILI